ncbi:MAG TPA: Stp1/IreP family PP2C-type Ser/Thr phosphatase, partial [Thermoanaerobaculia bacterium]
QEAGERLLIVADGMGGHRGGATASRLAAETVQSQYVGGDTADVAEALREALLRANERVFNEAETNEELHGMGTTTSVLLVRGRQAWFAHVGDSRIYLIRDGGIHQLTEDHSLVASMVREGLLTSKEAENHPRRNVLQRSLGIAAEVEIDVSGPLDVQEHDTFVICSDGLHGVVKTEEIKAIADGRPIGRAADELVNLALERGGPDNVTLIVARAEKPDQDVTLIDDEAAYDATIKEIADPGAQMAEEPSPDVPSAIREPRSVSRGNAVVKWAILFSLVLSAAGACLFFSQEQMFQTQNSTAKR